MVSSLVMFVVPPTRATCPPNVLAVLVRARVAPPWALFRPPVPLTTPARVVVEPAVLNSSVFAPSAMSPLTVKARDVVNRTGLAPRAMLELMVSVPPVPEFSTIPEVV